MSIFSLCCFSVVVKQKHFVVIFARKQSGKRLGIGEGKTIYYYTNWLKSIIKESDYKTKAGHGVSQPCGILNFSTLVNGILVGHRFSVQSMRGNGLAATLLRALSR